MSLPTPHTVNAPPNISEMPTTRGYQQEMLDDSLKRNIIIAMDTGSGKTHIAVLRLKIEAERELKKISWFLAPTVALCEQQHRVIKASVPVSVGLISGALAPDQWKDAKLWRTVLDTHRVIVSTPQVLLDALRHSYINMGRDIGLMIFDEAHHAGEKHPYNMIMKEFYFHLYPRTTPNNYDPIYIRPMILGLTASPIYGGQDIEKSFRSAESNLDSTIRTPIWNRVELAQHVHRPIFKYVTYNPPSTSGPLQAFSTNVAALQAVVSTLTIDDDPYIKDLRRQLAKTTPQTPEYYRTDQKLSKVVRNQKTFTLRGMRDFLRAAEDILYDVGPWAADWYVWTVLEQAKAACKSTTSMHSWYKKEKEYLARILTRVVVSPVSYCDDDMVGDSSHKVVALIQSLVNEKEDAEQENDIFSGLIFVQRRDAVFALTELLTNHPITKGAFKVASLVGASDNYQRHAFLDITRKLMLQSQDETLSDFRRGDKNLIISTAVAEEGIDVQACGCVIRWDPPPNMVSWIQSRGRARRQRSTFTLMISHGSSTEDDVSKWEEMAQDVVRRCNEDDRADVIEEPDAEEDYIEFREPSTGALLTLDSAIPHLAHFVAQHPNASHNPDFKPLYDLDPPDFPDGWHSFQPRVTALQPTGPWSATVTLPKFLPPDLRIHVTKNAYSRKMYAMRRAAFDAYKKMYDVGLVDHRLLPLFFQDEEVTKLKQDIEHRVGLVQVAPQMNPWIPANERDPWYRSELCIGDLPPLLLFTRKPIPLFWLEQNSPPVLHVPREGELHVRISDLGRVEVDASEIDEAREYTRRLIWSIHGSRMKWDDLDFSYLILSREPDPDWDDRREWLREQDIEKERAPSYHSFDADADDFADQFWFPTDIAIVRNRRAFGKCYKFVSWRYDPLTDEEMEALQERYRHFEDIENVKYPLIVAEDLPSRTNLLLPFKSTPSSSPPSQPRQFILLPSHSSITLISAIETQYVYLLPSLLRALGMALTMQSMRDVLFADTPLYNIPTSFLTTAMTAPTSQEHYNYQRLETLGDTVLKYLASIQLLAEYPLWHEGYLSRKKDHAVSNVRLAKENMQRDMYQWIIRDRLVGKKWKPAYQVQKAVTEPPTPVGPGPSAPPASKADAKLKQKKKVAGQLSTKVLADVVESTIGAAYLHGGMDLGYQCVKYFDLGLKWEPLNDRVSAMLSRVQTAENELRNGLPTNIITSVEAMLGYTFKHKLILLEALTHASHQQDYGTMSYERMEFLGDAVLDMIVTDYLYHAPGKEYTPGHIHIRKSAVVNAHILAYLCLRCHYNVESSLPRAMSPDLEDSAGIELQTESNSIYLWNCLMHSNSHVLEQQRTSFAFFEKQDEEIREALAHGKYYPWAALTKLQAPKFFSDMVESLIGAVYLDSGGDLDAVRGVLRVLGVMALLERIVNDDFDVLHPVSRMSVWASREHKKVEYVYQKEKGTIACTIKLDGEPLEEAVVTDVYRGKTTEVEVKFTAAEKAIKLLDVKYTA